MAPLVDHVLFNAAAAAVLAPLAYASKWLRRPALTHVLWLVVLVRLIAPPMYTLPLAAWETAAVTQPKLPFESMAPLFDESVRATEDVSATTDELTFAWPIEQPSVLVAAPIAITWSIMALGVWAAGSAWLGLVTIARMIQFGRSLRYALASEERLIELVAVLSRQLGLGRPPRVVLLSNRISPCVWAGGLRPILALPAGWLDGLSRLQQTAVLVHELAHLRRRDHWVRWLETIVVALCWWHPVVWVARRELREAEELCCDGWVVAMLPAARRAYADALVDTLDFLATARLALPPLASGFGQIHELKRRIHMILKANPAYRAGRAGAILALGLALCLPFGVARSDEPQDNPPPRAERPREDRRPDFEDRERARAEEERARARQDRGRADGQDDEIHRLRDEMRKAEEQMAQAQQRLERLRRRMEELGVKAHGPGAMTTTQPRGGPTGGGDRPRANEAELEKMMLKLRLQELELREKHGENHPDVQKIRQHMDEIKRSTVTRGPVGEGAGRGDGPRGGTPGPKPPVPPMAPVAPRGGGRGGDPVSAPLPIGEARRGPGNPTPGAGNDPRIDELARAVSELRKAVEEMRRDRERDRRPPQANP